MTHTLPFRLAELARAYLRQTFPPLGLPVKVFVRLSADLELIDLGVELTPGGGGAAVRQRYALGAESAAAGDSDRVRGRRPADGSALERVR